MAKTTIAIIERILNEEIKPRVEEHDKILIRGNGEPSLQEKLRGIEKYMEEDRENRKYYSRLFISITASNVIAIIIAFVIWIVRIVPVLEKISEMQLSGL